MFLRIIIVAWLTAVALGVPPPTWPTDTWSEPWPLETAAHSEPKTSSSAKTTSSSTFSKLPRPGTTKLPSTSTTTTTSDPTNPQDLAPVATQAPAGQPTLETTATGLAPPLNPPRSSTSKASAATASPPPSTQDSPTEDPTPYDPRNWIRHIADPKAGPTFQIILSAIPKLTSSTKKMVPDVDIYDVDLFRTDKKTIQIMKSFNKTVICYFSGGTYEPSRPDSKQFSTADLGNRLAQWPSEKWVKLESTAIRRIMTNRIQLAHEKGCDAIDPDNIDAYGAEKPPMASLPPMPGKSLNTPNNGNGLHLTKTHSINYMHFLSQTALKYNLALGLKNALEIIPDVRPAVHFAVNEECVSVRECNRYEDFLTRDKKPVFHIEYPAESSVLGGLGVGEYTLGAGVRGGTGPRGGNGEGSGGRGNGVTLREMERKKFCAQWSKEGVRASRWFQTVLKMRKLDGWVAYCTGEVATTPTTEAGDAKGSGGRFSGGRGNFVVEGSDGVEMEGTLLSNDRLEMDAWTRKVAEEDGYPFAAGRGSERFISDEELMVLGNPSPSR